MNNKKWSSKEKMDLLRLFAKGKSYNEIAIVTGRSPNAIKLRIESIVYDNLIKGKSVNTIAKILHINKDVVEQLYHTHKSFKQSKGESVVDVNFIDDNLVNNIVNDKKNNPNADRFLTQKYTDNKHIMNGGTHDDFTSINLNNNKLIKLEHENHILEEILKNQKMKKIIKKLYLDDKLDDYSKKLYEKDILK